MSLQSEKSTIRAFHKLYYARKAQTWGDTTWLGIPVLKCPLDLWIYQEIIYETQPDVIVECGTWYGGSALYLASICDLISKGRVITIDIDDTKPRPVHNRIAYLTGSSVGHEVFDRVVQLIHSGERVMVILDSDHHKDHVLNELRLYSRLVASGSYLIVEDTNLNGHPVVPDFGPGPQEAVNDFLSENANFVADESKEKLLITASPGGYLKATGLGN